MLFVTLLLIVFSVMPTAAGRAELEAEYNSAFDALEADHSKLQEQFTAVNEQRDNLASIISDYEKNTSYLVELCR